MRPSTVSSPLFYSYPSNSHAHVRETAGVPLLNSGLEAQRQQLDLTLQRQRDTGPRDGTSQGGFGGGGVTAQLSPRGIPDSGADTPPQPRHEVDHWAKTNSEESSEG